MDGKTSDWLHEEVEKLRAWRHATEGVVGAIMPLVRQVDLIEERVGQVEQSIVKVVTLLDGLRERMTEEQARTRWIIGALIALAAVAVSLSNILTR